MDAPELHFRPDIPEGMVNPAYRRWTCSHPKSDAWDIRVGAAFGWCWTCQPTPVCAPFYGEASLVQVWRDFEDLRDELWEPYAGDSRNAPEYPNPSGQGTVRWAMAPERLNKLIAALPLTADGNDQASLLRLAVMSPKPFVDAFALFGFMQRWQERFAKHLEEMKEDAMRAYKDPKLRVLPGLPRLFEIIRGHEPGFAPSIKFKKPKEPSNA